MNECVKVLLYFREGCMLYAQMPRNNVSDHLECDARGVPGGHLTVFANPFQVPLPFQPA